MRMFYRIITAALLVLSSNLALTDEEALSTFQVMKPKIALELAQATLKACQESGYQVAVAVVERSGVTQVILRDQLAGAHTAETARRKAWTAANFKTDTRTMMEVSQAGKEQSGIRFISEGLMIGGGMPIDAAGTMVGAVGVSGAPSGELDEQCAQKGIKAIEEHLLF